MADIEKIKDMLVNFVKTEDNVGIVKDLTDLIDDEVEDRIEDIKNHVREFEFTPKDDEDNDDEVEDNDDDDEVEDDEVEDNDEDED